MKSINEYLKAEFTARKVLTKDQISSAFEHAVKNRTLIYKSIVELNLLSMEVVYQTLGEIFDIPFSSYSSNNLDYELLEKCSPSFMSEYRVVPLKEEDDTIFVLIDNPIEIISCSSIETQYQMRASLILITDKAMDNILLSISNKEKRDSATKEGTEKRSEIKLKEPSELDAPDVVDAPAVALANTLLEEAVAQGASDIHIEPQENNVRVRFRIDGILKEHCEVGKNMHQALVARYKIISGLDIAERRIPQDGKISLKIAKKEYDFRISTLPIIYGEKIVIRIYDIFGATHTIKTLANNKDDEKIMRQLIRNPNGIILLTGPTGSGKTTTLYAFLRELNKPGVNIQTVEDPVENQIPGINQLQTNTKTGLTFASALRSILRQDPNIIMVGEIRDQETAHIAVQAAITGHLVFSTIHTNDAITTISRLIDMDIEPYLVSDSLAGAISQRLVRTLCPKCKKEHVVTYEEAKMLGIKEKSIIYEPNGCPHCSNTGYKGRAAVFEIMTVGKNVRDCISKKNYSSSEIFESAKKDGLIPLKQKVAQMVANGITTIEEFSTLVVDDYNQK